MKIKVIDFSVREDWRPYRPHGNDAGADVYMPYDCTLKPGDVEKVLPGFGIEGRTATQRMCFHAWGRKRHGRVWEHQGIAMESRSSKAAHCFREAPLLQSELF